MIVDQIEKDIRIAASIDQVWVVLTERVEDWFSHGAKAREIELRPGGIILLDHASKNATTHARIITINPPHHFSYRWAMAYPGSEPTEGNSTLVEFRLTSDGETTVLRVIESGFASLVIPAGREYANSDSHSRGWPVYLEEIRIQTEELALK